MLQQELGHAQRRGRMTLHPELERLDATQYEIGIERRQGSTGEPSQADTANAADGLGRSDDDAAEKVTMAAEKLGCGMNDKVGAEFDRPLQDRRAKGVVDNNGGR